MIYNQNSNEEFSIKIKTVFFTLTIRICIKIIKKCSWNKSEHLRLQIIQKKKKNHFRTPCQNYAQIK